MKKIKITLAALAFIVTAGFTTAVSYANRAYEAPNCSSAPNIPADLTVSDYDQCLFSDQFCCYEPMSSKERWRALPE